MRVLIACEFSGVVRDAFASRGHDAWSCDLLPSETAGNHIQGNVLAVLQDGWDLLIAHPPCTHLAVSGARWFKSKGTALQRDSLEFFLSCLNAPIPQICVENPVSIAATHIAPPHQIIQPWQFGHPEQKTTCLWLKNLPRLIPTCVVSGREQRIWKMPPSKDRGKERSRTYSGIADAMASQWNDSTYRTGFGLSVRYSIKPRL